MVGTQRKLWLLVTQVGKVRRWYIMLEDAKQGAESSGSLNALVLPMRNFVFLALFLILPSSFPTKKHFLPKKKKKTKKKNSLHKIEA